jgi:hypothetical protein
MRFPLNDLIVYFRTMCDDNDISLQDYSDEEIIRILRVSVILMEGSWPHGYTVELNNTNLENPYYEIVGEDEIPQWLQLLFVLKGVIGTHAYRERYSFNNKVAQVTNADQSQNKKTLKEFYDEILNERKFSGVGYSYNTWQDFFARPLQIADAISAGYTG